MARRVAVCLYKSLCGSLLETLRIVCPKGFFELLRCWAIVCALKRLQITSVSEMELCMSIKKTSL